MTARFLNREDEQKRLKRAMKAPGGALAVIYGRRRCGKSTLLQRVISGPDVYLLKTIAAGLALLKHARKP